MASSRSGGSAMADTRNALAELADKMKNGYVSLFANGRQMATFSAEAFPELGKAVRIIEELAKASDAIGYADEFAKDGFKDCIYIPVTQQLCVKKILKCRTIAEEKI